MWASCLVAPRQVFLDHPYPPSGHGFGNEDYTFNCDTRADDIKHIIAPETIQFYRRKAPNSLLTTATTGKLAQPYSKLFEIKTFRTLTLPEVKKIKPEHSHDLESSLKQVYFNMRKHAFGKKIVTPIVRSAKSIFGMSVHYVPKYVKKYWIEANQIENQLYPTKECLENVIIYDSENYSVGLAYYDLIKNIEQLPDYIFIVPWIVPGGADKVLLNYLHALEKIHQCL